MQTKTVAKICGLKDREGVDAAVDAGAAFLGFNFFPKSPRYVDVGTARDLAVTVPSGVAKVALVVDADDALISDLTNVVPLDFLQLHGQETPERVLQIKADTGLPVIKAVGIADKTDLEKIDLYAPVADLLLIDAKPPKDGELPGGNGLAFDWRLVANRRWSVPWMLAGGLTAENVGEAVALTGARQVDVSSGVETSPGVKDPDLIRAFLAAL